MFERPVGTLMPEESAWCGGLQALPIKAAAGAKTLVSGAAIFVQVGVPPAKNPRGV